MTVCNSRRWESFYHPHGSTDNGYNNDNYVYNSNDNDTNSNSDYNIIDYNYNNYSNYENSNNINDSDDNYNDYNNDGTIILKKELQ